MNKTPKNIENPLELPDDNAIPKEVIASSIGIVKRFEFSAKLQRMSTIVRSLSNPADCFRLYVKGSPEKIFELCLPNTIPKNFHEVNLF